MQFILIILLNVFTFIQNIFTLIYRLNVSTFESVKTSYTVLFKLKYLLGICLLFYFIGLVPYTYQSEVQVGIDVLYECALTYPIQIGQSVFYWIVRVPINIFAQKYDSLIIYLEDSLKTSLDELIAINDIASIDGIEQVIEIFWDEFKVFAEALFIDPDLEIPYFSNIVLNLEEAAFCYVDAGGSLVGSVFDGTVFNQNCEICYLDPNKLCPISQQDTLFGLSDSIFAVPDCTKCRDPINDFVTCTGNVINLISGGGYSADIFNVTNSISCMINQIIIPPIFFFQGLIFDCLESSIGNYIEAWFTLIIDCFNGFIEVVTQGRFTSFWDIFFKYIFPFIQDIINGIEGLRACDEETQFKDCLQSWPNDNSTCQSSYCGSCIMASNGEITQGLSTCFTQNVLCISQINSTLFTPILPLINILPDVIEGLDYIVCPIDLTIVCFQESQCQSSSSFASEVEKLSCEFTCVANKVPVFSSIANLISELFNDISLLITNVQSAYNSVVTQIDNIWTDIEDLPETVYDYVKDKLHLKKDYIERNNNDGYSIDYECISPRFFPNGSYNHFRMCWPPKIPFSQGHFSSYANSSSRRDDIPNQNIIGVSRLGRRFLDLKRTIDSYKISNGAESLLEATFNVFYKPYMNSTAYLIWKNFYSEYKNWDERYKSYSNNNNTSIAGQFTRDFELTEIIKKQELETLYVNHVNSFIYNWNQWNREIKHNNPILNRKLNISREKNAKSFRSNPDIISNAITTRSENTIIPYMTQESLLSSRQIFNETSNRIRSSMGTLERLKANSHVFNQIWNVLDRNFNIEHNKIFQNIHMSFSVIKNKQGSDFLRYMRGEKGYLVDEGFVPIQSYERRMEKRNTRDEPSILDIITSKREAIRSGESKHFAGPFLLKPGNYTKTQFFLNALKNEVVNAHIKKESNRMNRRENYEKEDNNNNHQRSNLKRSSSSDTNTTDYNDIILNAMDSIISYFKGIHVTPFQDEVSNIRSAFDNYDYDALGDKIVGGIEEYFEFDYPQVVNGSEVFNPWCFPLMPYDMFNILEVLPNSNIPLQLPWPQEFVTSNCTKVFNGDSYLFHFSFNDNCKISDYNGPYCSTCDYCPREYDRECKDLGFQDFVDSFFFIIAAIPRIFESTLEGGLDIKTITPYIISIETVYFMIVFNITSIVVLPIIYFLTYILLYTMSEIFGGIIPYGLGLLAVLALLIFFSLELGQILAIPITVVSLISFFWLLFRFIPDPHLTQNLNLIEYTSVSLHYLNEYAGFIFHTSTLNDKAQRFNYDTSQNIPYVDKYCFFWTFGNTFLGFFSIGPIIVISIFVINYGLDVFLFIIALINQLIQLIKDISTAITLSNQDKIEVQEVKLQSKLQSVKDALSENIQRINQALLHNSAVESIRNNFAMATQFVSNSRRNRQQYQQPYIGARIPTNDLNNLPVYNVGEYDPEQLPDSPTPSTYHFQQRTFFNEGIPVQQGKRKEKKLTD